MAVDQDEQEQVGLTVELGSDVHRRTRDGDEEEEEEPDAKRARLEEPADDDQEKPDAEGLTFSDRVRTFRDLLASANLAPFMPWEKAMPKLVFDSRFNILSNKEDKLIVYQKFMRELADNRSKKHVAQVKATRQDFESLLEEAAPTHESTWSDFKRKFAIDRRFRNADPKMRETRFREIIDHLKKKHKDVLDESIRGFRNLLKENNISSDSQWQEIRPLLEQDSRCTALEQRHREATFTQYVEERVAEQKRRVRMEQERKELKDAREQEAKAALRKQQHGEAAGRFMNLLAERITDQRFFVTSSSLSSPSEAVADSTASTACGSNERSWDECREMIKSDPRFDDEDLILSESDRKQMFDRHREMLREKRREQFRSLLAQSQSIDIVSKWERVRDLLSSDPRFYALPVEAERERLFSEYVNQIHREAIGAFKQLLVESERETVVLTPDTPTSGPKFKEVKNLLKLDKRYSLLSRVPKERDQLVIDFIVSLRTKTTTASARW